MNIWAGKRQRITPGMKLILITEKIGRFLAMDRPFFDHMTDKLFHKGEDGEVGITARGSKIMFDARPGVCKFYLSTY